MRNMNDTMIMILKKKHMTNRRNRDFYKQRKIRSAEYYSQLTGIFQQDHKLKKKKKAETV